MGDQAKGGQLPVVRPSRFHFCPRCGVDLEELTVKQVGELIADPIGDTFWKGERVFLSASQRLMLDTLITGAGQISKRKIDRGFFASVQAIAERADISVDSVKVELSRIRKRFRAVDPSFDHIEEQPVQRPVAHWAPSKITLFDDNSVSWRSLYRVYLSPDEARGLALIIKARGEPVHVSKLMELIGKDRQMAGHRLVERIRAKFRAVDPEGIAIATAGGHRGYRLALPFETKKTKEKKK
jgi:DNA-binding winged helix-turn-helix (wHTH) protein